MRPDFDGVSYGLGDAGRDYGDWNAGDYVERRDLRRAERSRFEDLGKKESWHVPGPFEGVGPEGYQRSDERIREEICERMARHGTLDASAIRVDVESGIVVLEGAVDSRWAKRVAEGLVDSVRGVKDVQNRLRIEEGNRTPWRWRSVDRSICGPGGEGSPR
jgi:hypothetical protein